METVAKNAPGRSGRNGIPLIRLLGMLPAEEAMAGYFLGAGATWNQEWPGTSSPM